MKGTWAWLRGCKGTWAWLRGCPRGERRKQVEERVLDLGDVERRVVVNLVQSFSYSYAYADAVGPRGVARVEGEMLVEVSHRADGGMVVLQVHAYC
jgi:hypothetical protein